MNVISYVTIIDFLCMFFLIGAELKNNNLKRKRKVKRIINGQSLRSHELYNTHHMVQIKQVFGCINLAPQYEHNFTDCQTRHMCGGSIIHPYFVMTACHCMTYKTYYSGEYSRDLPDSPVIGEWSDPWAPHGEYKSVFYPYHRDEENERKMTYLSTYHPLFNTMALFAGSPWTTEHKQIRHGSSFYPHSRCMQRSQRIQQYKATQILWDFGLIKACQPFNLRRAFQVGLAPIRPTNELEQWTDIALKESTVCLYAGWGVKLGEGEEIKGDLGPTFFQSPKVLQHAWRYIECTSECSKTPECIFCSHQHGPAVNYPAMGDSGGAILCDGHAIGIHSSGGADVRYNFSYTVDFTIACAADSVNDVHLEMLKTLKNDIFHWMNGKPIPNDAETLRGYLNSQTYSIPSQFLSNCILMLQIILLVCHHLIR